MKLLLPVLLSFLPFSDGHIWAWMLSMPYNKPEDAAGLTRTAAVKGSTATCDHDRTCGRGLFCDRHFGLCMALRHEGQFCRKDSQCVRGLGCMYGRCQDIIPVGLEGSRCQQDEDCAPSMCCARHHGEMICKRKLPVGESCFVPDGGLAFSINQLCPCQEGLSAARCCHRERQSLFTVTAQNGSARPPRHKSPPSTSCKYPVNTDL